MKYQVKVTVTMHCPTPTDALRVVEERLRVKSDPEKVKFRRATVRPIGRPSWHQESR